jgi:hypothetical protein
MSDGLEYIELSQYNSDILNNFEIENVLTFTKYIVLIILMVLIIF